MLGASTLGGNLAVTSSGNLSITGNVVTPTLTLTLASGATATQTAPITANLELLGSGASYALTNTSNHAGTLAGSVGTGSIQFNNGANDLVIGSVGATTGVTASTLELNVLGSVTQTAAITAGTLNLYGQNNIFDVDQPATTMSGTSSLPDRPSAAARLLSRWAQFRRQGGCRARSQYDRDRRRGAERRHS